jgi:hypothetical protein
MMGVMRGFIKRTVASTMSPLSAGNRQPTSSPAFGVEETRGGPVIEPS